MPPKGMVCYICGREFGLSSIAIHEPQCMKKWEIENSKLPKNQRRPPPQKPMIFPSIGGGNPNDIERMNQAAYESAQNQLIPCANCGRTFAPDRLPVHERSCRPKPGQGGASQSNGYGNNSNSGYGNQQQSEPKTSIPRGPVYVICYICGRIFSSPLCFFVCLLLFSKANQQCKLKKKAKNMEQNQLRSMNPSA